MHTHPWKDASCIPNHGSHFLLLVFPGGMFVPGAVVGCGTSGISSEGNFSVVFVVFECSVFLHRGCCRTHKSST